VDRYPAFRSALGQCPSNANAARAGPRGACDAHLARSVRQCRGVRDGRHRGRHQRQLIMQLTARMAAMHAALWGFDRYYRWAWYVWPASLALLIAGWICIDKPGGTISPGDAKPIRMLPVTPTDPSKALSLQSFDQLFLTRCFGSVPGDNVIG